GSGTPSPSNSSCQTGVLPKVHRVPACVPACVPCACWAASSALAAPVASRPRTRTRAHRATNALRLAISFPPRKSGRRLRPVPDSRRNRPRLRQHHRSACPQLRLPAAPPTVYTRRKGVIQRGISMARILIVDDSPSQLLGIQRIVEKLGHQTLTAEDGAAGVEVAKAELPDLILMDVVMP